MKHSKFALAIIPMMLAACGGGGSDDPQSAATLSPDKRVSTTPTGTPVASNPPAASPSTPTAPPTAPPTSQAPATGDSGPPPVASAPPAASPSTPPGRDGGSAANPPAGAPGVVPPAPVPERQEMLTCIYNVENGYTRDGNLQMTDGKWKLNLPGILNVQAVGGSTKFQADPTHNPMKVMSEQWDNPDTTSIWVHTDGNGKVVGAGAYMPGQPVDCTVINAEVVSKANVLMCYFTYHEGGFLNSPGRYNAGPPVQVWNQPGTYNLQRSDSPEIIYSFASDPRATEVQANTPYGIVHARCL